MDRDKEDQKLSRCVEVTRGGEAIDQEEANLFFLAGAVLSVRMKDERLNLQHAGRRYFAAHPGSEVSLGDVVNKGWAPDPARLRTMLEQKLNGVTP
ncbi:MAG: hypothetical protein Q8O64_05770 [Sideroxyarcus sp.]|nr:hypothetical protein [Sideroxyarcus sp.]